MQSETDSSELSPSEAEARRLSANNRLKERLEELMKENTTLRDQFDEAVQLTGQIEDLHKVNAQLLTQIRDLRAEKDDLSQRLEILVQKDRETSQKLKNEKNTSTSQRGSDLNSMNKEIEKVKAQSKAQIDSIYEQLDEANQKAEKENVEKRLLICKLENVITSAGRYFERDFDTIEDVLNAFKQNRSATGQSMLGSQTTIGQSGFQSRSIQPGQSQLLQQQQQQKADQEQLRKKIKKLKKQLNEKDDELQAVQEEKVKLNRDFERIKRDNADNIQNLSAQLQQTQEQMQRDADQYNHNLSQYESKINSMKVEMEKEKNKFQKANEERKALKRQLARQSMVAQAAPVQTRSLNLSESGSGSDGEAPPSPHSLPPHGARPQHFSQDYIDTTETFMQEKAELTDKLAQVTKKRDQLAKLLQQKDQKYHELEIDFDKIKNELAAMRIVYDEQHNEVENLRSALATRDDAQIKAKEIEPKEKLPDPKVVKLQKVIQDQKQKYYELQLQNDKKDTQLQNLQLEVKHLNQKVQDAEEDAERAQNETKDLRSSMLNTSQPSPEEIIPPSAFRCSEFPPDLSAKVAKIANNPSLQPVSKIQSTYKVIRKYYMQQVTMRDNALDEAYSENQTISSAVNQFLVDASIAIDDQPITFKDFFSQNAGKDLVDKVQQIRSDNSNLHHENEQMKATLSQLRETFIEVGDGQDPATHIIQIRERLDQADQDLQNTTKKMKSYKSQLKKLEQETKKNELALRHEIDDLKQENEILNQHHDNATKQIQDLRNENQRLTVELSDVTHTREDLESTIIQEHDEQIQQATQKYEEQIEKLSNQLRNYKQQYNRLEADYQGATDDLAHLRQQITSLKAQKTEKDNELKELQKQTEENEKALVDRCENEKESIRSSYQETIDKLKEQCEKHREDVKQANVQLANQEIQVSQLKAQVAKVTKEKLRAINEISQMKDQLKRNQQLVETSIRSNQVTAESEYNKSLQEYKNKVDSEKRSLYRYAADAFSEYYNPGDKLNEGTYKTLIDQVHDKIEKLQKTDATIRRMAGASNGQTTEDAIAQLLL